MAIASKPAKRGRWAKLVHIFLHELREVLPPTIFFFLGFNLILFTKRLILADHLIQFAGFFVATTAALVVGKVGADDWAKGASAEDLPEAALKGTLGIVAGRHRGRHDDAELSDDCLKPLS